MQENTEKLCCFSKNNNILSVVWISFKSNVLTTSRAEGEGDVLPQTSSATQYQVNVEDVMSRKQAEKTHSWRWHKSLGLIFLGALIFWSNVQKAEAVPPILREGNHAASYHFSIGAAIGIAGLGGAAGYIANSIGYHLNGTAHGPALGGNFDIGFSAGGVALIFGGRFWWDIPVARRMAIFVAPFIQPGLALFIAGAATPAFDLQFGVEGKITLHRRLLLTLRPIAFDIQIGGNAFGVLVLASIHIMHLGVGVTF